MPKLLHFDLVAYDRIQYATSRLSGLSKVRFKKPRLSQVPIDS